MEEVKIREMQIFDYKKKIAEAETKLKQQQNLYEAVRSDRNLYSKNLIESQDEIQEMKRKLKIMNHQIDQLKEEISAKDSALLKERLDHQDVEKHKEQLKVCFFALLFKLKLIRNNKHTISFSHLLNIIQLENEIINLSRLSN